jgi:hypothetical protein
MRNIQFHAHRRLCLAPPRKSCTYQRAVVDHGGSATKAEPKRAVVSCKHQNTNIIRVSIMIVAMSSLYLGLGYSTITLPSYCIWLQLGSTRGQGVPKRPSDLNGTWGVLAILIDWSSRKGKKQKSLLTPAPRVNHSDRQSTGL